MSRTRAQAKKDLGEQQRVFFLTFKFCPEATGSTSSYSPFIPQQPHLVHHV
jgi:hypothetical protein